MGKQKQPYQQHYHNGNTSHRRQQYSMASPPDRTFPTPNPTTGKTHVAEEKKFHEGGNLKAYAHEELREDGQPYGRASDPVKYYLGIEQRARERQVAYETVRLLREDVIECYRKNGVN